MPSPLDRFLGDSAGDADLDAREREAAENLRALVSPDPYGIDDCDVTEVVVVNEGPEGEPIVVPVARFSLGAEKESPDYDVVWELAFGGSGLFDAESCRRMSVSRDIADRVVTEVGWRVADFKSAMIDGHDVDDEVAPVAWGQCTDYTQGPYGRGAGAGTGGTF